MRELCLSQWRFQRAPAFAGRVRNAPGAEALDACAFSGPVRILAGNGPADGEGGTARLLLTIFVSGFFREPGSPPRRDRRSLRRREARGS